MDSDQIHEFLGNSWPIYGHDWAVEHLRKSIAHGRLRHAYLLLGAESVGKNRLAHALAMALNCTHDDEAARPCLTCRSCKLTMSGNHPDMLYSSLDENTGALKIEAIRNVTHHLAMKPYEARYRVAIFQDFDHAQPRAQDALLKSLEEPPPYALLILLAHSAEPILPTITSRSQILHLRPVAAETIHRVLVEQYGADDEHAELLARLSGGRIGWAIQALDTPELLDERETALNLLEDIIGMNRVGRFDVAQELSRDKLALTPLFELWQTYWRDLLLLTENSAVPIANTDRAEQLQSLANRVTIDEALAALRATSDTLNYLKRPVNTRLALEVMFLDFPGLN